MKRFLTQLSVIAFAFILAKLSGPGTIIGYFGANGDTVAKEADAMRFDSIKEAYSAQINLGTDWDIISEG